MHVCCLLHARKFSFMAPAQLSQCPSCLFVLQLLKQTRGGPPGVPMVRAWQLFYLLACLAPPGRAFVALVCEYVHSAGAAGVAAAPGEARQWAAKTWAALKRSTKAGPRRQVRGAPGRPPADLHGVAVSAYVRMHITELER